MVQHGQAVTYTARDLLALPSCRAATAVERMARRWYLDKAETASGRPDVLLAPRFGPVPPLRITCPEGGGAWDVFVTGWCNAGWFSHLRVSHEGASYPVTVADPVYCGRPGYEERMAKSDRSPLWRGYALTVPAGAAWIEIGKTDEMEACLVAVEFRPCPDAARRQARRSGDGAPIVAGITDTCGLAAETLQAYDWRQVADFYRQMADMGFSHLFQQVYGGSAAWSRLARPYGSRADGHAAFGNWNEPGCTGNWLHGSSPAAMQRDIDAARAAGLKVFGSFRINNEWLADWVRDFWKDEWPPAIASRFSVDHPEWWMTYKDGTRTGGGLDFAFAEVREYRAAIIEEWCGLVEGFDGVCIDLYRHPPMVSYPEDLVRRFRERTGIDVRTVEPIAQDTRIPEWHAFRAEPFTEFMRMVRAGLRRRYGGGVRLAARVANTTETALADGADLAAWFRERLVDLLLLQNRPPANPLEADSRPIVASAQAAGVRVVPITDGGVEVRFDAPDIAPFRPHLDRWREWGMDGFGFYEAERAARDGRWRVALPDVVNGW